MSGNIMGLIGVTILAVIGTAVVAIDHLTSKRHKKTKGKESHG
ncbi:hypothetical protein [Acidithiobacillus sulfuriphilus]